MIRTAITAYYNYRIDNAAARLESQQALRTTTITKLKAATKYDSTQELLEKYGGAPPKPKKVANEDKTPARPKGQKVQPGRTSTGPPPPTANIGRPNQIPSAPTTPQPQVLEPQFPKVQFHSKNSPARPNSPVQPSLQQPQIQQRPTAEFAPNAYSTARSYAQSSDNNAGGNWYDRVLDLLMGEDETSPKNRVALICTHCRLVNGQAPPGTKSLADLGRWRCFGCGGWNGEEDEGQKAVQEMKERIGTEPVVEGVIQGENVLGSDEELNEKAEEEEAELDDEVEEVVEVKQTAKRGRPKGSRNKT